MKNYHNPRTQSHYPSKTQLKRWNKRYLKKLHLLDYCCPVCELVNNNVTNDLGISEQYCEHFIQTVESVGCAGTYCYEGDDPQTSNSYLWVFEPYDWFNQPPEVQTQKLVEAVNGIKDKAYDGTAFTKYRIVEGFWDRVIIN